MDNKTIIIVVIAAVVLIIGIFAFTRRNQQSSVSGQTSVPSSQNIPDCVEYTQQQYDKEVKNCRTKCAPKALIPVLGAGYFLKCMNGCKQNIPLINIC